MGNQGGDPSDRDIKDGDTNDGDVKDEDTKVGSLVMGPQRWELKDGMGT